MAFTAIGQLTLADMELAELKTLVADPSLAGQTTFSANTGVAILRIAPEVVAGEIAAKRGEWDEAVRHLDRAVRFEDALVYQEPHDWHAPARQNLAGVLLAAGHADEAETVLWEDLKRNPEHVWTLRLLSQALRAQNKNDEAALIDARFRKSWKGGETLTTAALARFGV
jgi:predicted Zn-dependent protease